MTSHKGFQKGKEHHLVKGLAASKSEVLEKVRAGWTIPAAMASVNKKADTIRQWMNRDPEFARNLEEAKEEGQKNSFTELGIQKESIEFSEFSQIFLNQMVFPHHQDWVDLLEGYEPSWLHPSMIYEPGENNRLLVNVPPEHAKSTVITVNYSTYRIALNPNIRIIVVSKTLNKAREFVYAIKQRLSHPRWLKLQTAYGPEGGWKGDADTWRTDTVYLGGDARNSSEKDPTLQALGMGGQIYGARADLIILDDCITTANAHEWEKQMDWLQKEVITRLGKNGKLLVVGTRIAANDLYKELRNPKHWSGGRTPFTYMGMPAVLEYAEKPEDWVTLWEESDVPWDGDTDTPKENGFFPKWDGEALFKRRSEVTPSTWALVYQQEDIQEDSIFPPMLVQGATNGMRKRGPLRPGAAGHPPQVEGHTVIGFDPAMAGNAAFVVATYNRADGRIYILDCINMSEPTPQKIRATIEELTIRYKPQEFRVEINAHQKAYSLDEELRNWLASYGVRLDAHFTGKNKWDTSFGVASMSNLFGTVREEKFQKNNIVELPSSEGSEGIKALTQQLLTWKPETRAKTDCVMAMWFAIIRIRELMQSASRTSQYASNRWATRAQKDQRFAVNLDEMFAEQWQDNYGQETNMVAPLIPIAVGIAARLAARKVAQGKIISKSTQAIKNTSKASRIAKDKQIIARSPDLKQTPNMTIKQAKRMKQGTASLAKTTKRIAKQSGKKGSYGNTTVGESNAFKIKMGLDKPFGGVEVKGMPALSTPSLGGLTKGPANMTLNQLDKLNAIRQGEKAKAYAAAFRQAKRETKDIKKSMQSNTTRTVKKVVGRTAATGAAGSGVAYAVSKKSNSKNQPVRANRTRSGKPAKKK